MSEYTVLVTDHKFNDLSIEREKLADLATVEQMDDENEEVMVDQLSRADAILTVNYDIDERFIERATNCKVISRYGIGFDNIDVEAADRNGIYVTNVPYYCVEEVSNHAVALLLVLQRRIVRYDRAMTEGGWKEADVPLIEHRLSTQTIGILGFGRIGRSVADRLSVLGPEILVVDPYLGQDDIDREFVTLTDQDELLEQSDFITIHSPLTSETHHLLGDDEFTKMKENAFLINVARGPIVNEEALIRAVKSGEIGGAGLDVFETEPLPESSPLRTDDRVITTPHMAWQSGEADTERRYQIVENVLAALQSEKPPNVVNDPL